MFRTCLHWQVEIQNSDTLRIMCTVCGVKCKRAVRSFRDGFLMAIKAKMNIAHMELVPRGGHLTNVRFIATNHSRNRHQQKFILKMICRTLI